MYAMHIYASEKYWRKKIMWGPVTVMKHWIWKVSTEEDLKKKKESGDFKEKAAIIYPEKGKVWLRTKC